MIQRINYFRLLCIALMACATFCNAWGDSLFERGGRKAITELKDGDKIIIESAALTGNAEKYLKAQPKVSMYAESSFVYSTGIDQYSVWELVATGSNDPTYTSKPTFYLRSVNGGYYLGFSTDEGTNNVRCLTTMKSKAYAFVLLNMTEAKTTKGSSPNWDANSVAFQATAKNIQLGNSPTATTSPMVWMYAPTSTNAPSFCPWNVYEAVEGESDETVRVKLNALLDSIDADDTDYSSMGNYTGYTSFQTALAEAKSSIGEASASAMQLLDVLSRLSTAYSGLQQPVADLFDIQFNEDGSATDISPMHHQVTKVGVTAVTYNEAYQRNMVSLVNSYGGSGQNFYKTGSYSGNSEFIQRLSDGHTLEAIFRTRVAPTNSEAKYFSSHQGGGTGLMLCTQGNGKNGGNEITFLPNIGGWKWATSGIVPQVDVFYHVVGVWNKDEGLAYIYVNGELKNKVNASGSLTLPSTSSQWFGIGADPSGNNGEASGKWDIVASRIYDQPLTDYQVALLYKDLPQAPDPLVKDPEFMGGLTMKAGAKFPIDGKGFCEGDKIIVASGNKSYTLDLTVREDGCHFVIPEGLTSATYTLTLIRGNETQMLGSCAFVIKDEMPGGCAVIAHRGWWTKDGGTAQNSRESLRNAIELDCYGSETDVWATSDGRIMVSHDGVQNGVGIQGNTYSRVKDLKLSNGELLPSLDEFFDLMEEYPESKTKLIIELKFNSATDIKANAKKVVALVKQRKMQDRVEYISYSLEGCQQVVKEDPTAWVGYLGNANQLLSPAELYADGIMSTDYQTSQYKAEWIAEAESLGMKTNVYTIDSQSAIINVTNMGINLVTTNYPDIAKRIYRLYEYNLPNEDEKAYKALSNYVETLDADTTDYSDSRFMAVTTAPFFNKLGEARQALEEKVLDAEGYQTILEELTLAHNAIRPYPTADAFDAVFDADGSAQDISPIHSAVETVGNLRTYRLPAYETNIPIYNAANGSAPTSFHKVNFATNKTDGRLREALTGGHTVESVVRICQSPTGSDSYWMSAYNKGAFGLLVCSPANGLNKGAEFSYMVNVSPFGATSSPVLVPSGIEAVVDTFYHIIAVWDQDSARASIYVNGELCNSMPANGELHFSLSSNYQWLCLGGTPASGTAASNGGMFDIVTARIYNDALTEPQINYLWQQASAQLAMANAEPTKAYGITTATDSKSKIYDLKGRTLSAPQQGINIECMPDGTVVKRVVR